jgi:hypothetical protein
MGDLPFYHHLGSISRRATGRMRRFSTLATVRTVESITVDDLDRQLAQCLGLDGRASFSAIAEVATRS